MFRKVCLFVLSLVVLAGCGGTTTEQWRKGMRGAYLEGYADGSAAEKCKPVAVQQGTGAFHVMVDPRVSHTCAQADVDRAALKEVGKEVDYNLSNNKKEREQSLMRYLELGGRAAK